jgi:hypothetical protein
LRRGWIEDARFSVASVRLRFAHKLRASPASG